jgi:transposase
MARTEKFKQRWGISDEFWEKVAPLIPQPRRDPDKRYARKAGAGRKPIPPRRVFEAIVFVLRTGIQWRALPAERFGSASAIHRYFQAWQKEGFFLKLWREGLAEYEGMEGIAWAWQSIDGAMVKAPLAQEMAGPNPTDRGKKRQQAQPVGGRAWHPAVTRRQRSEHARREASGKHARRHRDPAT